MPYDFYYLLSSTTAYTRINTLLDGKLRELKMHKFTSLHYKEVMLIKTREETTKSK